jgi:hypothetical protein
MRGKFRRRWPLFFVLLFGLALPSCSSIRSAKVQSTPQVNPSVDESESTEVLDITPKC